MEKEKEVPLFCSMRILLFSALLVTFLVPVGLSAGISLYGSKGWLPTDMVSIFCVVWLFVGALSVFLGNKNTLVSHFLKPISLVFLTAVGTMCIVAGEIFFGNAFLFILVLMVFDRNLPWKISIVWVFLAEALSIVGSAHFFALGSDPLWTSACTGTGMSILFVLLLTFLKGNKKEEGTPESA